MGFVVTDSLDNRLHELAERRFFRFDQTPCGNQVGAQEFHSQLAHVDKDGKSETVSGNFVLRRQYRSMNSAGVYMV